MNLPVDFINRMQNLLPDGEAESFLHAMQQPPAVAVKINRRKPVSISDILRSFPAGNLLPDEADVEKVGWCASGFYLPVRPQFTLNPLLHAGCFYVQDPSSMIYEPLTEIAVDILDSRHPLRVLDLCAAPGGKTTSIINALPDGSLIVANEINPQRAATLRENLAKWGYPDTIVTNSSSDAFAGFHAMFDIIAVDAPCSGEGMMRKDDTARSQWSPGLIRQCSSMQKEILENAVKALRPGGLLIYSTCTFNCEENEEQALWLTDSCGLKPVSLPSDQTESAHRALNSDLPALRFMPHTTRGEGLFVIMLQKPHSGEDSHADLHAVSPRTRKKGKNSIEGSLPSGIDSFVNIPGCLPLQIKDDISLLSPNLFQLHDTLKRSVRVIAAGVNAATLKGRGVMPTAQLALSTVYNRSAFGNIDLDRDSSLRYLRHETLPGYPDLPGGYLTVSYVGQPLGFIKNIGSRSNNLYNKDWKIRNL